MQQKREYTRRAVLELKMYRKPLPLQNIITGLFTCIQVCISTCFMPNCHGGGGCTGLEKQKESNLRTSTGIFLENEQVRESPMEWEPELRIRTTNSSCGKLKSESSGHSWYVCVCAVKNIWEMQEAATWIRSWTYIQLSKERLQSDVQTIPFPIKVKEHTDSS